MATKLKFTPRRLIDQAYVSLDTAEHSQADILNSIAHWLYRHPFASVTSIRFNYGSVDDENYAEVYFDSVYDEDL
jgi:hypothetical protein